MVFTRFATAISAVCAVANAGYAPPSFGHGNPGFPAAPAGFAPSAASNYEIPTNAASHSAASSSWGSASFAQSNVAAVPSSVAAAPSSAVAAASSAAAAWSGSSHNYGGWQPPSAASWTSKMSQNATNGKSTWGTLENPSLAPWVNGPMPSGTPWAGRTADNCNQLNNSQIPNTGMTRQYNWVVSEALLAPDGVQKNMIVVNGQYPGPLIEANWGDWIEVTVTNNRTEGSSIHWHGFLQTGTPYMDGTPGISQCPIAPGSTFTYRFRAELYGTSWWHGHYSAQYIDGLVGPMVVHGPVSTPYDIDLGPIMVSDWFHGYYEDLVYQIQHATPVGPISPPEAVNVLINGKANYDCSVVPNYANSPVNATCTPDAGLAQFRVQSGKKHLMRFINSGAEGVLFVSIDNHEIEVIAQDFVPLVPYNTTYVTLAVGQRTDVIFYADGAPTDSLWLRVAAGPSGEIPGHAELAPAGSGGCNINTGFNNVTTAAIYYENADTSIPPNTTSDVPISPSYIAPLACQNDPLTETVPFYPIAVAEPDLTLDIIITGGYNDTGAFVWWMNNVTYLGDFNDPILLEAKLGQTVFDTFRAVNDWSNYTNVRINLTGVGFPAVHPMHVHGHNMQILASGLGYWDGTITNPSNPTRRDVWALPPLGYTVFQWDLNNPGVWPFHCHIAWHTSEGMNLNFIEGNFANEVELPYVMAQTCRDWSAWTGQNVVNVIDSGL